MGRPKKYNQYDLTNDYGIGYTTNKNEKFYFDLEDYDKIKEYCWATFIGKGENHYVRDRNRNTFLHNLIMNNISTDDNLVDHIDGNGLNNKKDNLRIVTKSQNSKNRKTYKNNPSGYTGVIWRENRKRWRVRIQVNNKQITIGHFKDLDSAIKAREEAEMKYFGEYRRIERGDDL